MKLQQFSIINLTSEDAVRVISPFVLVSLGVAVAFAQDAPAPAPVPAVLQAELVSPNASPAMPAAEPAQAVSATLAIPPDRIMETETAGAPAQVESQIQPVTGAAQPAESAAQAAEPAVLAVQSAAEEALIAAPVQGAAATLESERSSAPQATGEPARLTSAEKVPVAIKEPEASGIPAVLQSEIPVAQPPDDAPPPSVR
jgi:hypothetical protein